MTNREFAERVGCHHSTASLYRHGLRRPGMALFHKMVEALELPKRAARQAWFTGPAGFSQFLHDEGVFS